MKIEWLNEACTRARVTKGWFRRVSAEVRQQYNGGVWRFVANDVQVASGLNNKLDSAQTRALSPWQPIPKPSKLPKAKVMP